MKEMKQLMVFVFRCASISLFQVVTQSVIDFFRVSVNFSDSSDPCESSQSSKYSASVGRLSSYFLIKANDQNPC